MMLKYKYTYYRYTHILKNKNNKKNGEEDQPKTARSNSNTMVKQTLINSNHSSETYGKLTLTKMLQGSLLSANTLSALVEDTQMQYIFSTR